MVFGSLLDWSVVVLLVGGTPDEPHDSKKTAMAGVAIGLETVPKPQ